MPLAVGQVISAHTELESVFEGFWKLEATAYMADIAEYHYRLGMLTESLRSLPYLVHTNRELGLMLAGTKPLAIFSYIDGYEIDFVLRYLRLFDRQAAVGRFTKHEKVSPLQQMDGRLHHQIFYTLPNEDWRVNAMLELLALPGAWSNERERRYGTLLGYEDWQNDVWISRHPVQGGR